MMASLADYRDRTPEFRAIIEQFTTESQGKRWQKYATQAPSNGLRPPEAAAPSSELNQAAAEVSRQILQLETQLGSLRKLSQNQSLFQDASHQITQLSAVVRASLSQREAELQLLSATADDQQHATQQRQSFGHVVQGLKTRLVTCTKDFTVILQQRTRLLKQQNARRKNFESDTDLGLRKRRAGPAFGVEDDSGAFGGGFSGQQEQMGGGQRQRRAEGVEQMESTIAELGQMYTRLAHMVGSQGDMVIRIDSNLDDTLVHAESGHNYLVQMYDRVSGNQGLIIKIFIVIIVVAVLLIAVMR